MSKYADMNKQLIVQTVDSVVRAASNKWSNINNIHIDHRRKLVLPMLTEELTFDSKPMSFNLTEKLQGSLTIDEKYRDTKEYL